MERTVRLALERGVRIGAHPGVLEGFLHIPVVQQQPGALLIQIGAVARQILVAI